MSTYNLSGGNKLGDYVTARFSIELDQVIKSTGGIIPKKNYDALLDRWVRSNKSFKIIKSNFENESLYNAVYELDKKAESIYKITIEPVVRFFLELGAQVLKNATNYLSVSSENSLNTLLARIDDTVQRAKNSNDPKIMDDIIRHMERLEAIGDSNMISPTEGIVFQWNKHIYKFTGAFAPIHQIVSYFKY